MAENIFIAYFTGTIAALILWIKSDKKPRTIILALLLAVGLCLVKFEGSVASLFIGFSLLLIKKNMFYSKRDYYLICLFFVIILLPLLWMFWIKYHNYMNPIYHFQSYFTAGKFFHLLEIQLTTFFKTNKFILFFFAFGYLYLNQNNRKWDQCEIFLLSISVFLVLFSVFANVGMPYENLISTIPEVGTRLFLHASTAIMLLWSSRAFVK